MVRPLGAVVGSLAAVVGAAIATACGGDGSESSQPTTSTAVETTVTTLAPTTTTAARVTTTTRAGAPRTTTATTARPAATVAPATTTTQALTRAAATQALCKELETAVRQVTGGNTIGGGLRLTRAVNTYGSAADPAVVSPTRRMLSAALNGDLDSSAVATREAATACSRAGYPVSLPVPPQCITAPCP